MTMSNAQRARISASAGGASGKAENARAAAFAAAETGSPSPAQAFRLAARPFGSTARSSRAAASRIRPGSRLGGRPAPSRHSDKRFAAGPPGSPTAKRRSRSAASSALTRRILAEAAALCSASRERNAPAAGGSARRKASRSASPAPAANSGSPSPALPLARAQAGTGAGGGKACCSGVFAGLAWFAHASRAAREALLNVRRRFGEEVEIGANHRRMMSLARRFVTLFGGESAPLVVGWRCPIRLHYRTRSKARPKPMPNTAKPGPATLPARPEAAPEAAFRAWPRRRKIPRGG